MESQRYGVRALVRYPIWGLSGAVIVFGCWVFQAMRHLDVITTIVTPGPSPSVCLYHPRISSLRIADVTHKLKPNHQVARSRRSCVDVSEFSTDEEVKDTWDRVGQDEHGSWESNAASLRKVTCTLLATASLMWSAFGIPKMAMAETAVTPYSQSDRLQLGLLKGRIRPCPSDINPNCVSTSSSNAAYAVPWRIPPSSSLTAIKKIESTIIATQKNPEIVKLKEVSDGTRAGHYLEVEVDGFLGRDVMEFLVRDDVVTYRSMAMKVVYVYPFTTPIGDFGTQEKHIKILEDKLSWTAPSFEATD